jgi:hypothetical protein
MTDFDHNEDHHRNTSPSRRLRLSSADRRINCTKAQSIENSDPVT